MNALYELFVVPLRYEFMQRALLASVLVGVVSGVLGCFVILRRMALMGDAIAHAVLPGVAIAYLLKLSFFLGAVATGVLTALGIGWVTRNSKVKEDSAIGVVFSGAFALGVLLLSVIRSKAVDLGHILFGNVLGVSSADLAVTAVIGAIVLAVIFLLYKEWVVTSFDPVFAAASGLPVDLLHYLLMLLLSLATVAALQTVGIVLVVAMLVTPGALAFLLTDRLPVMLGLAALSAVLASVTGLYLSFWFNVSSGAAIVLVLDGLFALAMLLSPRSGVLWRALRRRSRPAV